MAKNKGGKGNSVVAELPVDVTADPVAELPTDIGGAVATADEPTDAEAAMVAGMKAKGATHKLIINGKCRAFGVVDEASGSVLVFAGSTLSDDIPVSDKEATEDVLKNARVDRALLAEDGVIEKVGGVWTMAGKYRFRSLTKAVNVLAGVIRSGPDAWKGIDEVGGRPGEGADDLGRDSGGHPRHAGTVREDGGRPGVSRGSGRCVPLPAPSPGRVALVPGVPVGVNRGPDMGDGERAGLELLVDRWGVRGVLEALAVVCGDKADHLRHNWGDGRLAAGWELDGRPIGALAADLGER